MKIKDILISTNGILYNKININEKYNEIKINSKEIKKNDIFVAIVGKKFDGHNFIDEAIKKGAKIIITSKNIEQKIPYIKVKDTIKALGDIAKYMIKKYHPNVIAITGSVGKTTTKSLIYHLLKDNYRCITNEKNYNNNIGVPLTVFKTNSKTELLIMELGMNHPKEISYLSKIITPDISVITKIGTSHIGYLKSKKNILKAKLEIIDGMKEKILFINGDDKVLRNIKKIKTITSGINKNNDLTCYDLTSTLYYSSFIIKYKNKKYKIKINLPQNLIEDVLIAINVALYYNVNINEIIKKLKTYKTIDKRMNIIKDKNNNIIINDCYNSSYESLTGVLKIIKNEKQKKLLILGDIKELGQLSKKIHNKIKPYIEDINNKQVILIGKEMANIKTQAKYFNTCEETIKYLKTQNIKNNLILIKGSRSMQLENITNYFLSKKIH